MLKVCRLKIGEEFQIFSNSSFFLGCTGIGIRIERNVNDKADCFISSFNIPYNLGYPRFDRNFMYIAGGNNDDFNATEIEIFGIEWGTYIVYIVWNIAVSCFLNSIKNSFQFNSHFPTKNKRY